MRTSLAALLFFAACGHEAPLQWAIDEWGMPVSPACLERLEAVEVAHLPPAELHVVCGSVEAFGCSFKARDEIYVSTEARDPDFVLAHEYMHILLDCETGDSDHAHKRAVWSDL